MKTADADIKGLTNAPALVRVSIGAAVGACAGVGDALFGPIRAAPLVAWDGLAVTYLGLTWWVVWPLSASQSARRAARPDRTSAVSSILLTSAALVSLVAVGAVLFGARKAGGGVPELLRVGFGVASVVVAWVMVHTIYTLRYATIYYSGADRVVDFNQPDPPSYRDFAYLSFTIGMTFQVSDTPLLTSHIRRLALVHALISFALGTVILAATVNLIAGLSSSG